MSDNTVALIDRLAEVSLVYPVPPIRFIQSLLAEAVDDRPEGDCSNGLLTNSGIAGTLKHCFSPELL